MALQVVRLSKNAVTPILRRVSNFFKIKFALMLYNAIILEKLYYGKRKCIFI